MKKWLWIPILVILIFLFCCQKQDSTKQTGVATESGGEGIAAIAQTIGANLDMAVENLEKGQLGDGTGILLDSVLLVKPLDQWPEGFVGNVSSAKEHFTTGNFSDAVGYVSKALNLIKHPDDTDQSTESGAIASVAAAMKGKIVEAKEEFKKGNGDQGVIAILEALQLFAPGIQ
jgi:hypothetical protein